MNDYDFSRLNDKEFEVLCTDIIGASEGIRFERFKPGRDSGVDGRYFCLNGGEWILQAKHWAGTPYQKLLTHIRNSEAPKVGALRPERYILVLSHSLSRANKSELTNILRSNAICPIDIYGREDLNDLLAQNPQIERRHFKLWISSTTVLALILNNAIQGRSDAMMMDIIDKSKIFVQTKNFDSAIEKLDRLGTVIITGQAGIGKTTLAEQLILLYSSSGFQLTCISHDISEAEQAYNSEEQQLFYFDDFLGRNYLQALSGHEGSQIINFIKRISRDRVKKKFLLTSRSTILNQGRILNDVFELNKIDKNEMEIRLDSLSSLDKAHILYNHIWHSGLDTAYVDELYSGWRYRQVIAHKNFNPRIIQFITDPQRVANVPPTIYWNYISGLLNNPAKIWEHPFDVQIDDYGRLMVLLVAFNGEDILEQHLVEAYARAIGILSHINFMGRRDFHVTIRHLSNSLLTRIIRNGNAHYKLFNPSLGDFLLHRYASNLADLESVFKCLRNLSAVGVLLNMSKNQLIDREATLKILNTLFEYEENTEFRNSDSEYVACLFLEINTRTSPHTNKHRLEQAGSVILNNRAPMQFLCCLGVLLECISKGLIPPRESEEFAMEAINIGASDEEMPLLGKLITLLESDGVHTLSDELAEVAQYNLLHSLTEYFDESDVFRYGYDLESSQNCLEDLIVDKFSSWNITPTEAMIDDIIDAYDVKDRIQDFLASQEQQYSSSHSPNSFDVTDIDELFQRDR